MAESSRRRSKRPASYLSSNPPPPPNPEHLGIIFPSSKAIELFNLNKNKIHAPQKFIHEDSLHSLFVHEGVKTLFTAIGWVGLFNVHELSCRALTLEFLSTAVFTTTGVRFQLLNRVYTVTKDQICDAIGAPKNNCYNSNAVISGYNDASFWCQITGERHYQPSRAKASSIIHPVLRVTHRIIASIIFPREERSTVNSTELKLLYAMLQPFRGRPYFGSWVLDKLQVLATSKKGQLHCGGMVTFIAKLAGVPLPGNLEYLPGCTYLTVEQYRSFQMFRVVNGGFNWTAGPHHDPQILVTEDNKQILNLDEPIRFTDWLLSHVLNPTDEAEEEEQENEEEEQQQQQQPHADPTGAGSSGAAYGGFDASQYPPYHTMYMEQFQNLNSTFQQFNSRLSNVESNYSTFHSEFTNFRDTYNTNRASEQTQFDNISSLLTGIRDWTINQPGYHPPPPPEY